MRRNLLRVMALMAPAILVYASPAQAQLSQPARAIQSSYYEGTEGTGRYLPVSGTKEPVPQAAATAPAGSCGCNNGGCDNGCCDSCCDCCDCWEGCEECPSNTLILFAGIESWRGFADGSWNNNNGAVTGANFGTIISQDYGIGFQFGGSFGVYDWNGRGFDPPNAENNEAQTQLFLTTGFFKKADACSRWSFGLVYDFSFNNNFGVFSNEPYVTQWRGQISYATSSCNEFGVWATIRDHGFSQDTPSIQETVSFWAVNQTNLFWHHKFDEGADSYVWVGVPDWQSKLGPNGGSLGDFIIGGMLSAPISDRLALYANVQYMHPSAQPGLEGSMEETWDVGFGLAFYPQCNARTHSVSGSCSAPLLGVANNGTFMMDASHND